MMDLLTGLQHPWLICKDLNTGKITPEESFNNTHAEEVYESEHVRTATKKIRVMLNAKYEKAYLHKVMEISVNI